MKSGVVGFQEVGEGACVPGQQGVERLLAELHEKKRWLDQMIEALEVAASSPQHTLIAKAASTFEAAGKRLPKVDLRQEARSELQTLAQRVGGGKARSRRGKVSVPRRGKVTK